MLAGSDLKGFNGKKNFNGLKKYEQTKPLRLQAIKNWKSNFDEKFD